MNESRPLPPCTPPAARLWVGFSGGLDSTVLLHWLKQNLPNGYLLQAIHVHHGLQADADDWQAHCQALCADWSIALQIEHIRIADGGHNVEQQARDARHAAFARHLQPGDCLALAHHADDAAETLLLRLLRGSGGLALANMAEHSRFAQSRLWRPLLHNTRADLERYANLNQLHYINDGSNSNTAFDRNFLRHEIMPRLEARFANVPQRLAHSARLLRSDAELLQPHIATALDGCRQALDLRVHSLLALPREMQAHVLRLWLSEQALVAPGVQALREFLRQLAGHRSEQQTQYRCTQYSLQVWNGNLILRRTASLPAHQDGFNSLWDGSSLLELPRGGFLHWQGPAPFGVRVCYRQGGERIQLPEQNMHHSVKKLLSTRVPPWQRDALPFVYNEHGELLAVGTVLISKTLAECMQNSHCQLQWLPKTGIHDE